MISFSYFNLQPNVAKDWKDKSSVHQAESSGLSDENSSFHWVPLRKVPGTRGKAKLHFARQNYPSCLEGKNIERWRKWANGFGQGDDKWKIS